MDFFIPDGGGGLTAPFHLTFGAGPCPTLTYNLASRLPEQRSAGSAES
jgi:hypothetical protein